MAALSRGLRFPDPGWRRSVSTLQGGTTLSTAAGGSLGEGAIDTPAERLDALELTAGTASVGRRPTHLLSEPVTPGSTYATEV